MLAVRHCAMCDLGAFFFTKLSRSSSFRAAAGDCCQIHSRPIAALIPNRILNAFRRCVLAKKIIRAKQSSCQLSTYFVGRMAFQRLRRRLQNELGERFELGRFHEACLDHGTLPVRYLTEVVSERLRQPR